jgi:GNAT superfamily N-acetyltransferase
MGRSIFGGRQAGYIGNPYESAKPAKDVWGNERNVQDRRGTGAPAANTGNPYEWSGDRTKADRSTPAGARLFGGKQRGAVGDLTQKVGTSVTNADKISQQISEQTGANLTVREKPGLDAYGRKFANVDELYVSPPDRGQGKGSAAMKALTNWADVNKRHLSLNADSSVRGEKSSNVADTRLKKFYKQFGFVENKGRNKDFTFGGPTQKNVMYRLPNKKESTQP